MAPRPSLANIARTLGVSTATVSNAISGKGRVSEDLASRIRKTAEDVGYVPSVAGRALRTGRSGVLGLVLPDIANPLFPQIAQAIEAAASDVGYGVLIADSRGDISAQTNAISRLIERGADGLVIIPRHGSRVADIGRPVAIIDSPSTPNNTVASDHWDGGVQTAKHLLELGHRKFVLIGQYSNSIVQNDRVGGMRSALSAGQLADMMWVADMEAQNGTSCDLGLANCACRGVTAFMTTSDLVAVRALNELNRAGLVVPTDVSLTGFDDLLVSSSTAPTITTVQMNAERIAETAVAALVAQIEIGQAPQSANNGASGQAVPMRLIVRRSSGPARQGPVNIHARDQGQSTTTTSTKCDL